MPCTVRRALPHDRVHIVLSGPTEIGIRHRNPHQHDSDDTEHHRSDTDAAGTGEQGAEREDLEDRQHDARPVPTGLHLPQDKQLDRGEHQGDDAGGDENGSAGRRALDSRGRTASGESGSADDHDDASDDVQDETDQEDPEGDLDGGGSGHDVSSRPKKEPARGCEYPNNRIH
ncbi:hypothetical protein ABE10_12465, partial [Bacillus toyonensis]|nr:hypothetical protein [Bacillus toyonensis]